MATALLAAAGMCCAPVANAQPSPANADAMYNGYLSAYLVTVDSTHAFIATSITDRTHDYMWHQAYEIASVEAQYQINRYPIRLCCKVVVACEDGLNTSGAGDVRVQVASF